MGKWERRNYSVFFCRERKKAIVMDLNRQRMRKLQKRIAAWADVMGLEAELSGITLAMVMLTYRKVEDYEPGHIKDYLRSVKNSLGVDLVGWSWVAELQKRGAVHYHVVFGVKKDVRIPKPDESGMWPYGWSGIQKARTAYYLMEYTSKKHQKQLNRYPKGCRLYGVSVRGLNDGFKALYKHMSGLDDDEFKRKRLKVLREMGLVDSWEFVGSSVRKDYATDVLASRADDVLSF